MDPILFIKALGIILVLLFFHELSHILAAKVLNLKIEKVGFALRPLPHPFVSITSVEERYKKVIFLAAGAFSTFLFFILSYFIGIINISVVYYALSFQLIIETNPFYSDFITMFNTEDQNNMNYKHYYSGSKVNAEQARKEYIQQVKQQNSNTNRYYTLQWYVHFFMWLFLIHILLSPKMLKAHFLF